MESAITIAIFSFALVVLPAAAAVEYNITQDDISGMIKSPEFPDPYPDDLDITWNINARPGFRIKVYFTEFDLEDSYDETRGGSCVYDFLEITERGKVLKRLCGNRLYYPSVMREIKSSSNALTLRLVSDFSNEEPRPKGFRAHYKQIDVDECTGMLYEVAHMVEDWDHFIYCNHHCHNVPGTYYCSCEAGFRLHENNHTCTNICTDQVMTALQGTIATSNYKSKYSKLARCNWTIKAEEGVNTIALRFVGDFGIEDHPDEGCVYDMVWYKTANGFTSENYCGKTKPKNGSWIFSESHEVAVFFYSDLAIEDKGFRVEYEMIKKRCKMPLTDPENGVMSANLTNGYFELGDAVEFRCNIGYRLIGQTKLTCSQSGNWNAEQPICQIKTCKYPSHLNNIKNGRIKDENISLTYNSTVTVWCYQWYEMVSGTSVWRCNENGSWVEDSRRVAANENNQAPECQPMCGIKGTRKIRSGNYSFGDAIIPDTDPLSPLNTLVLRGKDSQEGEWPWAVFVDLRAIGRATERFCGGSLISNRAVLTAAHCLISRNKKDIRVFLGLHSRHTDQNSSFHELKVSRVAVHAGFNEAEYKDDIGILILEREIQMGKYVRPICLPNSRYEKMLPELSNNDPVNPKYGVVAGWGLTETAETANKLQKARLPLIQHKKCVTLFEQGKRKMTDPEGYEKVHITENMLCAGYTDGKGKDSCKGDSGGPYMYQDPNRHIWFLNGLVSFGSTKFCGVDTFGIYTNVSKYMTWIFNNMHA